MDRKALFTGITFGLVSATAHAAPDWAKGVDAIEKCAGIVLAGQNDCGANGHACSGMGEADNDPNEWAYMPVGVCAKVGGNVIATKERVITFQAVETGDEQ